MLRLSVLLLVLANAGYFAWAQGLLAPWGVGPAQQAEPQRLAQQIKPHLLGIIGGEESRPLESAGLAAGSRPAECLQAGVFDEAQAASLRQALQHWPPAAWSLEAAMGGQLLKLPVIDDALRARLEELKPALSGKQLRPCR